MWNKLYDFAYDATVGLVKRCRRKTLELIKITASQAYLKALRVARKHLLVIAAAIFAIILSAVAVVVVPVALIMVSAGDARTKMIWLTVLGLVYLAAVAFCLQHVLSEEKWMKASGFKEWLDSIDEDHP